MTITEEQIQQELDAIYVGDVTGKGAHIGRLKAIVIQQRSEVERLRAELLRLEEAPIGFVGELKRKIEKLQAENAELKSKYARFIALGNLENYVGYVIDKPIKYSEEK